MRYVALVPPVVEFMMKVVIVSVIEQVVVEAHCHHPTTRLAVWVEGGESY